MAGETKVEAPQTTTREKALETRRGEAVAQIAAYQRRRGVAGAIAVLVPVLCVASGYAFTSEVWTPVKTCETIAATLPYSAIALLVVVNYSIRLKHLRNDLKDIDNQLDMIRIPEQSHEQKAQKLLQIQQFELKRYYDQTLRQSTGIFWVGIAAMLLGFLVIAWSLYFVGHNFALPAKESGLAKWSGESVVVGVLGAVGGILTNFVGAMYIKMFSEIIQAVTKSHVSLVSTSHFHLANVLAANIRSEVLREKTLADLALGINFAPTNGINLAPTNSDPSPTAALVR
jgi:hypothetical protein